jgi:hypothetical protein
VRATWTLQVIFGLFDWVPVAGDVTKDFYVALGLHQNCPLGRDYALIADSAGSLKYHDLVSEPR